MFALQTEPFHAAYPTLSGVSNVGSRFRCGVLMAVAAFAVHQLRYVLAYGGHADHELAEQGHSYFGYALPVAGVVAAIALGLLVRRLAIAWRTGEPGDRPQLSVLSLWLVATVGLVAIYTGQELLEGLLSSGHPPGLHGVFGHGGWVVVPTAFALAGVIALAIHGTQAATRYLAEAGACRKGSRRVPSAPTARPTEVLLRPRARLTEPAAERAPPFLPSITA